VDISNVCSYRARVPYTDGVLSEWLVHVVINGDEHQILVTAVDEHDIAAQMAANHGRGARMHHQVRCHDTRKLIVEWGNVKTCSVGEVEWVRTWGPDGEVRARPDSGKPAT
jgi:hypothetical protein